MADYDDTNRGALFKNDKKEKDTHPDYKGSINVDGTEYWVSSWIKTSKSGGKFMSLSVTPKEEAKPTGKSKTVKSDELDDVPF